MTTSIKLNEDEMAAGMLISDSGTQYRAALQAVASLEAQYQAQLRAKYKLDDRWVVRTWLTGFECMETGQADGEPNN